MLPYAQWEDGMCVIEKADMKLRLCARVRACVQEKVNNHTSRQSGIECL